MAMYLGSNKVEIGTSSGGGSSSDFSMAQVTFINTLDRYGASFHFTFMESFDSEYYTGFYVDSEFGISNIMDEDIVVNSSTPFIQKLYIQKDKNVLVQPTLAGRSYTISGNVVETTYEGLPLFIITGDCTITIS